MTTSTSRSMNPNVVRQLDVDAFLVPASITAVPGAELPCAGADRAAVHLTVAVAALTAFTIQGRVTNNDTWFDVIVLAASYTTPKQPLIGASGDLTIQGVGSGWFVMDVRGFEAIRIRATSGGTATLQLAMSCS